LREKNLQFANGKQNASLTLFDNTI